VLQGDAGYATPQMGLNLGLAACLAEVLVLLLLLAGVPRLMSDGLEREALLLDANLRLHIV
jgi:hypothetical protein